MNAIGESAKVATGVIETLKGQPLALALIVINVLFLAAGIYILREVVGGQRSNNERKDALITSLANAVASCPAATVLFPPRTP
jgi:hypothetical protein